MGLFRNLRFLWQALRMRLSRNHPIFLTHMITSRCDCRCITCHYWKLGKRDEMSTKEIYQMLKNAYSHGMTDYVIWGGEPLLRTDLPRVATYADDLGMDVTVITNGKNLPEQIGQFADSLYGLIVSIDHPKPSTHNAIRRQNGVYETAIQGIRKATDYPNLSTYINCVVTKENFNVLEEMCKLAEALGIKIMFEMMEVVEGYNEEIALNQRETATACRELIHLKDEGYPIANSVPYLESVAASRKYTCQVPKAMVTIKWNGDVSVCSTISERLRPKIDMNNLGNITESNFPEILNSKKYEKYVRAAEKCWKCDLSYPRETAHLWSLDRDAMKNFITRIM